MRFVAVVLPFVPTTWIAGKESCGSPSAASRRCMRSRPNSSGQGVRASSQAVAAALSTEGGEVALEAGELVALRLDDLGGRVRDEALVREHLLGAFDLLPEPRDLRVGVAVRLRALRLHDRGEDPLLLLALERDQDAGAPERHGRVLHRVERTGIRREAL